MPECVDANRDEYSQPCNCDDLWITRKQSQAENPEGSSDTAQDRLWLPITLADVLRQLEDHFGSEDKAPLVIRMDRLLGGDSLAGIFGIDDFLITTNCRKNLPYQRVAGLQGDFAIADIETMLQIPYDEGAAETRWRNLWAEAQRRENN